MAIFRAAVDLDWGVASGSPGVNVWHMRTVVPGGTDDEIEGLMSLVEDFYTAIRGLYPIAVSISWDGTVQEVSPDPGNSRSLDGWAMNGSASDTFLPPANCMLVNWRSGSGGRRGRGRSFIGPLTTATQEDNGTPDETDRETLRAAAAALVSASLTDLNGALGVYSRTDSLLRDFTSASVPNIYAVLRSRRD